MMHAGGADIDGGDDDHVGAVLAAYGELKSRERERDRTTAAAAAAAAVAAAAGDRASLHADSLRALSAAAAGVIQPKHFTGAVAAAALAESAYDDIVRFLPPACEAGAYTRSDFSST